LKSTRVLRGLPSRRATAAAASNQSSASANKTSAKNRKNWDEDTESSSSEVNRHSIDQVHLSKYHLIGTENIL